FQKRLNTETTEIIEDLFFDARHALMECLFRLDLRSSELDAPLEETFRIGETADEMVLRSQRAAALHLS
ncbi:MAG TPA: hypothetical protein VGP40_01910, partial [Chthoniobacterales bacterium]|nr:hypothetical protein [Chthoniobacterales bacterium]